MKKVPSSCRDARRDLLKRDDLDAVRRGLLDMHLRRCKDCRIIFQDLAVIEKGPLHVEELDEERRRRIYRRLVPAVHEITAAIDRGSAQNQPLWRNPIFALGAALAATLVFVSAFLFSRPETGTQEQVRRPTPETVGIAGIVELEGLIDQLEGTVLVQGKDVSSTDRFSLEPDTTITMEEAARFGFSLDGLARVALLGKTDWTLTETTDEKVALEFKRGRLAIDFDNRSGKILTIRTPSAEVHVKGTVFTVEAGENGQTTVGVLEGLVEVAPVGQEKDAVKVSQGKRVTFPGTGALEPIGDAERAIVSELKRDADDDQPIAASSPADYPPAAYQSAKRKIVNKQSRPEIKPRRRENPRAIKGIFERAGAAMTAGDIPLAIDLLKRANKEKSGSELLAGLAMLAECYAVSGKYDEAADTFDRIIEVAPSSRSANNAYYEIGRIAMDELGDLPRAKAAFIAYVASPQTSGLKEDAYYALCELEARQGAHHDALHCFHRFLKSFGNGRYGPSARLWRGALYQDVERRWTEAEKDLTSFIKARPRHPRTGEARYRVALGRFQMGDKKAAMQAIMEYLRLHPDGRYRLRVERLRQTILHPSATWDPEKQK